LLAPSWAAIVAELITWCRIMRVGPACATPCDDCRLTSRRYNLAGQNGLIEAKSLAEIHAEIDDEE
jgi:hypothetical protein